MSKPSTWILQFVCAAAVAFEMSCSKERSGTEASAAAQKPVERAAVTSVQKSHLATSLTLTAEFQPDHEVDVMAKASGYLKKVEVDVGDRVTQGQLLATIEIPEMEDELARNAAAIARGRSEIVRSEQEVKRAETAREMTQLSFNRLASVMEKKPGLVAQQELDTVKNRDLIAQSQIATAKSTQAVSEQSLRMLEAESARMQTLKTYTRVLAPFSGVVTKRYAESGGMIQAGVASQTQAMPVVRIAQTHVLRLILPVPESAVPRLRPGASVEVHVPTLDRVFQGKVARSTGQILAATRTMETQVDVQNSNGVLVPGMFAQAILRLDDKAAVLTVPVDAIGRDAKGATSVLAVNASQILERRPVVLGLETPDKVEIQRGLAEGDRIVIGSRSRFKPGDKVDAKLTDAKGRD